MPKKEIAEKNAKRRGDCLVALVEHFGETDEGATSGTILNKKIPGLDTTQGIVNLLKQLVTDGFAEYDSVDRSYTPTIAGDNAAQYFEQHGKLPDPENKKPAKKESPTHRKPSTPSALLADMLNGDGDTALVSRYQVIENLRQADETRLGELRKAANENGLDVEIKFRPAA